METKTVYVLQFLHSLLKVWKDGFHEFSSLEELKTKLKINEEYPLHPNERIIERTITEKVLEQG